MSQNEKSIQPIEKPPSLHYSVQESIKSYITDNRLRAGDALPSENVLSKQLNVSRNLVREAVRGLESLGIVEIRRGSGLFVSNFSMDMLIKNLDYGIHFEIRELAELYAVRRALETGMIEDAMAVKTNQQASDLQSILEEMHRQSVHNEPFPQEDRRFHQCLFQELNNRTLLQILDSFWLTLNKADQMVEDIHDRDPLWTYNLHVPIVEAFMEGNVGATRKALEQHYINLEMRLKDAQAKPENRVD